MASAQQLWARQRDGFWRAHHEAWQRSELISANIARLRASRSRPSATGGQSSKPSRRLNSTSFFIDVAG